MNHFNDSVPSHSNFNFELSSYKLPPRIFITGTSTDIGKTMVSAILMCGTRGRYWKPVQSGSEEMTDTRWIQQVTGLAATHFVPERYLLRRPLSPHAAAALEGVKIALEDFDLPEGAPCDPLIVEGAGGVMVPLNERDLMLDLIVRLALPVVVVSSSRLGTINHTLLTLDKLASRRLEIAGVVMNGPLDDGNRKAIEHYGQTRVIAQLEPLPVVDATVLNRVFQANFRSAPP
jgi:dethiobiotin synthetase